jgi:formylmethanofuran dehydrogenase subunit E
MCEFNVLLDNGKDKRQVAKNVIKAKIKDGKAVLMDSSGKVVKVDATAIVVVDTIMAELVLRGDDISPDIKGQSTAEKITKITRLSEDLEALKRFHGHLGPYVVLGLRMGQMARGIFPEKIYATVFSGSKRPRSCMADGVQFSSCCTIGKANMVVKEEDQARAMFTDGQTAFEVKVLPRVLARIDKEMTHENEEALSVEMYQKDDKGLFEIVQIEPSVAWSGVQRR